MRMTNNSSSCSFHCTLWVGWSTVNGERIKDEVSRWVTLVGGREKKKKKTQWTWGTAREKETKKDGNNKRKWRPSCIFPFFHSLALLYFDSLVCPWVLLFHFSLSFLFHFCQNKLRSSLSTHPIQLQTLQSLLPILVGLPTATRFLAWLTRKKRRGCSFRSVPLFQGGAQEETKKMELLWHWWWFT